MKAPLKGLFQLGTLLLWLYGAQLVLFAAIRLHDHVAHRYVAVPLGATVEETSWQDRVTLTCRLSGSALIPGLGAGLCLLYVLGNGLESSELVITHNGWRYCRDMEVGDMEDLYTRRWGDTLQLVRKSDDAVRFTIHKPGPCFADGDG